MDPKIKNKFKITSNALFQSGGFVNILVGTNSSALFPRIIYQEDSVILAKSRFTGNYMLQGALKKEVYIENISSLASLTGERQEEKQVGKLDVLYVKDDLGTDFPTSATKHYKATCANMEEVFETQKSSEKYIL